MKTTQWDIIVVIGGNVETSKQSDLTSIIRLQRYKLSRCTTASTQSMHHDDGDDDDDDDDDGLSRRHDGSLVTDDEDEFGGVSRDQSEKHKCGMHTW